MPKYTLECITRTRTDHKETDNLADFSWGRAEADCYERWGWTCSIVSAETPEEARARVYGREGNQTDG